jgi:hypothetical protein
MCGVAAVIGGGALTPRVAVAMMAGVPPDSAAARIDPNIASSPWSGAVSVLVNGSPYSGVVIGPQHVLTASHVAGGQQPSAVQVVVNRSATPQTLAVAAVTTYPGAAFPYDDLTVLRLAQAVPAGTMIYPVVDTACPVGTGLTLVGYGASGSGATGTSVGAASTVKRVGRNVIDQLTDRFDTSGRTSPFFVYDFDGPTGNGVLGGSTLGNATETCVASGDSGSGAFIETASGPALYGLSTVSLMFTAGTAASLFGSGGGGLVLSHPPYLDWLRTHTDQSVALLSQAGPTDVPVAPAWALGLLGTALLSPLLRRSR